MKKQGDMNKFYYAGFPAQAVLVTCKNDNVINVITIAWHMPISKKPGLYGTVERKECTKKVVVAVLGESIKTHEILKNERMVEKINEAGREAMKLFLKNPSIENLFHISYEFSLSAGHHRLWLSKPYLCGKHSILPYRGHSKKALGKMQFRVFSFFSIGPLPVVRFDRAPMVLTGTPRTSGSILRTERTALFC